MLANLAEMLECYKAISFPSEDEKKSQSSLNARLEAIAVSPSNHKTFFADKNAPVCLILEPSC